IGAYYETINSPRYLNNNTELKNTIDQKVTEFINKVNEDKANNVTITEFTDDNMAYAPNDQFQHSTIHAINKLLSDVTSHLDENLIGATLIDLEKAFDTVWLYGLLYILIKNNFPEHLTSTIWSMIGNRSFHT
ncbi:GSCOCG00011713001-RA-CDS, partial [Cotesia congregata]